MPWGPLLLYGTGRFAYELVRLSNCVGICPSSTSQSAVQAGWTVGGGVEYGFAKRWSVKAEYLHYDLGNFSLDALVPTLPGPVRMRILSTDFKGNIVRIGVNFRF